MRLIFLNISGDESKEVLIHGYFNLREGLKTQLDLSKKYDKNEMKWIRFICFEPCSPQQRAWFIPIKGIAFGEPRALMRRKEVSFHSKKSDEIFSKILCVEVFERNDIMKNEKVDIFQFLNFLKKK